MPAETLCRRGGTDAPRPGYTPHSSRQMPNTHTHTQAHETETKLEVDGKLVKHNSTQEWTPTQEWTHVRTYACMQMHRQPKAQTPLAHLLEWQRDKKK